MAVPVPTANALLYPSGDTVVEGSVAKGDEKVHVVYHLPHQKMVYDGKRMRKAITRRTVDYNNDLMLWIHKRIYEQDFRDRKAIQPHELLPPEAMGDQPVSNITGRYVHTSQNKVRCPVNVVTWTPEGRRLLTGSSSGEFTLWNGLTFNFETILQAHDGAVRAMVWSHNENWMIAGDQLGTIKYWQTNMNNAKAFQGHKESIRGLSFCPTDSKFASCSDDVSIKIWDFASCRDENTLTGHGWDVKCIAWHPYSSMLVSGSKDNLIKIWDAKSATNIATLHGHKNTVSDVTWNQNGNWLLSCSRDQLIKLYDIRTMRELQTFRGHKREVTTLAWHPFQEGFFVSGGFDGAINFWLVGSEEPQADMPNAHDNCVWDLAWHPLGHVLCSGSNDHTTKFWSRNRPGDPMTDKYSGGTIVLDVVEDEHGNQQAINPNVAQKVDKKNYVVEPGLIGVRPEEPIPVPGIGPGSALPGRPSSYAPSPYNRPPPPHAAGKLPPPPPGMRPDGFPPGMPPPPPPNYYQGNQGQRGGGDHRDRRDNRDNRDRRGGY